MNMSVSKVQEMVMDREAWRATIHGVAKSRHDCATELNWTELCIMWPKYWSFSSSISPSNEYSGLISFRMDWFDLLIVYRTLKSLLQHHSSKASILWRSAFFVVHPYITTGKTITLTMWTFVCKVMSLLFNTLSRFVTVFPPRSKCLLISWLQSLSAVILEPKKRKSVFLWYPGVSLGQPQSICSVIRK